MTDVLQTIHNPRVHFDKLPPGTPFVDRYGHLIIHTYDIQVMAQTKGITPQQRQIKTLKTFQGFLKFS